MQVLRHYKQAK